MTCSPAARLNAHEADGLPIGIILAPQPAPHDLSAVLRAAKHDGYLVGALAGNIQLYVMFMHHIMYSQPFSVTPSSGY